MFRAPVLRLIPLSALLGAVVGSAQVPPATPPKGSLALPAPAAGTVSLDATLQARRTTRDLMGPALSMAEAAQLLWSAQGENRPGRRTVPSAHARYPLGLYLLTEGSPTLERGVYRYLPKTHAVRWIGTKGVSALFGAVPAMQPWIVKAPSVFVVTGTPLTMGSRETAASMDYTFWEAGAASQALLLQAAALGLGSGVASGVDLAAIGTSMNLPPEEKVLVLLPVGRMKPEPSAMPAH